MQMVPSVFTGKRQNDLRALYTHLKGKNINTFNLLFKSGNPEISPRGVQNEKIENP